jgi:hypothetical protein
MRKENALQLIGIAIFLIVTTLTYGIVTPVSDIKDTSLETVTNKITNTTANTTANTTTNTTTNLVDDTSRIANNYHILTAIAVGVVIAIVIVFFLGFW